MMKKQLAILAELENPEYAQMMRRINECAARGSLQEYTTYSRLWEYPWLWSQIASLGKTGLTVLDIGSQYSAFPWFLAEQGLDVIVSDRTVDYWAAWQRAERQLGLRVRKRILDAQNLALPTASVDLYLSVSVIEHIPLKAQAMAEAARVLRPGGHLVISFDICEPDLGMTFPEWNGQALTMREVDDLFRHSAWFDPGVADMSWNAADIPAFLAWNRATAPHHNYIVGAAVVQRNAKPWQASGWQELWRGVAGIRNTKTAVARWYVSRGINKIRRGMSGIARSSVRQ